MQVEQFCKRLLEMPFKKCKALTNLIMALASNVYYGSVTQLSLLGCYHYQYSSITDAISSVDQVFKDSDKQEEKSVLAEKKFGLTK